MRIVEKVKTYKLQADIINGVYEVDDFDTTDITDQKMFFKRLDGLKSGIIASVVDKNYYNKIKSEYGIRKI